MYNPARSRSLPARRSGPAGKIRPQSGQPTDGLLRKGFIGRTGEGENEAKQISKFEIGIEDMKDKDNASINIEPMSMDAFNAAYAIVWSEWRRRLVELGEIKLVGAVKNVNKIWFELSKHIWSGKEDEVVKTNYDDVNDAVWFVIRNKIKNDDRSNACDLQIKRSEILLDINRDCNIVELP